MKEVNIIDQGLGQRKPAYELIAQFLRGMPKARALRD
jgi:hypothetical protein